MPRRSPAKVDGTTSTPVILLGTTVTVLGALRLFAHRRIPAFVLSQDPDIEASSRWYRPLPLPPGEEADPARLESLLEHIPFEAAVLMPCTDSWARAVAGLRSSLAERVPPSQADAAAIATLSDKGRFAGLADGLGIPHPRTLVLRDVEEFDSLPDERFLGSFLKPRNSEAFYRRYLGEGEFFKNPAKGRGLFLAFNGGGGGIAPPGEIPPHPAGPSFLGLC